MSVSYPGLLAAGGAEAGLPVDGDFQDLHPAPFRNAEILEIMRRLWREGTEGSPNGSLYADGILMQLAAILLRLRNGSAHGSGTGPLANWRVRRTIDYLRSHLNEDVSIAVLASEASLSPFHFARAFRASTGLPPYAYLRMLRAARVRELLAGTSLSVTQIASEVGYATPQALSRMFRADTGMSPTEWRSHLRR